jgi:hypothetical protein
MNSLIKTLADNNSRKVIAHEIKVRELKGERTQLSEQEIKDILYEDFLDDMQPQAKEYFEQQKKGQQSNNQ